MIEALPYAILQRTRLLQRDATRVGVALVRRTRQQATEDIDVTKAREEVLPRLQQRNGSRLEVQVGP